MAWIDITAPSNWAPFKCEMEEGDNLLPRAGIRLYGEATGYYFSDGRWKSDNTPVITNGSGSTQYGLEYVGPALPGVTRMRVRIALRTECEITTPLDPSEWRGFTPSLYATNVDYVGYEPPCFAYWFGGALSNAAGDIVYTTNGFPDGVYAAGSEFELYRQVGDWCGGLPPPIEYPLLAGVTAFRAVIIGECIQCGIFALGDDSAAYDDILKIEVFADGFWTDFVQCEETDGG